MAAAEQLIPGRDYGATTAAIRALVLEQGLTPSGELAKSVGLDRVDANLISAAVPHGLVAADDPLMQRTIARIERELHPSGSGVHRHLEDVYYGGGVWVLLALHLAWYYAEVGAAEQAQVLVHWVEAQADTDGSLPEQIDHPLLAPDALSPLGQAARPHRQPAAVVSRRIPDSGSLSSRDHRLKAAHSAQFGQNLNHWLTGGSFHRRVGQIQPQFEGRAFANFTVNREFSAMRLGQSASDDQALAPSPDGDFSAAGCDKTPRRCVPVLWAECLARYRSPG